MFGSNCGFLIFTQVSQEAGKMAWIPISQHFPQFVGIQTIKGFCVVNEAEVDIFLELSCFFYAPKDVGNLISGSSVFLNPACISVSSQFTYYWSLAGRILSVTLLMCEMSAIVW